MGEIRFDVTRMKELANRLDDMANQLKTSNQANNDSIAAIELNIKGTDVKNNLSNYRQACQTIATDTYHNVLHLLEYLQTQINKYSQTEQEAADVLTDVQSILAGLE